MTRHSPEESVNALRKHRDNLAAATSFEEYKAAQISYVDYLIKDQEMQLALVTHRLEWALVDKEAVEASSPSP
jgi:hypothetical protein